MRPARGSAGREEPGEKVQRRTAGRSLQSRGRQRVPGSLGELFNPRGAEGKSGQDERPNASADGCQCGPGGGAGHAPRPRAPYQPPWAAGHAPCFKLAGHLHDPLGTRPIDACAVPRPRPPHASPGFPQPRWRPPVCPAAPQFPTGCFLGEGLAWPGDESSGMPWPQSCKQVPDPR